MLGVTRTGMSASRDRAHRGSVSSWAAGVSNRPVRITGVAARRYVRSKAIAFGAGTRATLSSVPRRAVPATGLIVPIGR